MQVVHQAIVSSTYHTVASSKICESCINQSGLGARLLKFWGRQGTLCVKQLRQAQLQKICWGVAACEQKAVGRAFRRHYSGGLLIRHLHSAVCGLFRPWRDHHDKLRVAMVSLFCCSMQETSVSGWRATSRIFKTKGLICKNGINNPRMKP